MTKKELLKRMCMEQGRLEYLFRNKSMPKYQGMLWVGFAFGTGCNHECDDVIHELRYELDYCLKKMSGVFNVNITSRNMIRIVGNYNGADAAFALNFMTTKCSDRHTLIVTSKEMYLIRNATDKVYLHLLDNGKPLMTFASLSKDENGRGVFDGEHLYFGRGMRSSLPERLGLEVSGSSFKSSCFHGNGNELIVGGVHASKAKMRKERGVVIVEIV